jgi:hypothetical protein
MHGGGGFSGGGHHGGGFGGHHHSGGLGHPGNQHHHTGDSQGFAWIPFFRRREASGQSAGMDKRATLRLGVLLVLGIIVGLLTVH